MKRSIFYALTAAALFGASTPIAKLLVGEVTPLLLGGLLYLGSGIGLCAARLARDRGWRASGFGPGDWPWFVGAIVFGGAIGPVALMFGLVETPAATAALLLNLEAVATAAIAWIVFREHTAPRVVAGMAAIVAGGVALAWPMQEVSVAGLVGPLAVAAACLCWAVDNNLTRRVSGADALFIAGIKGLSAGLVNTLLALLLGATTPAGGLVGVVLLVGCAGYGVSLVLFVLALRGLGTARTGAYFSTAPFIGAAIALSLLDESATTTFWVASALMALGVWLHLSETHVHEHTHERLTHRHVHVHDEHHRHGHGLPGEDGGEPHDHVHSHEALTHSHPHYPDLHHRHRH